MTELRRLTAIAGVVLAVMTILAFALDFVIIVTTGAPPLIALATLPADLVRARDSAIWPIDAWLYTLQIVPFTIFVVGLRARFRSTGQEAVADIATVAALLFMALHTLHNLAIVTVVQTLAPSYVPGAPEATAIEATARGLLGVAYAAYLPGGGAGGLFFVAAMAGFATAQRRSAAFAAGSGSLAIASAVLSAVAYAQYVIPAALYVGLIGWLAYIAWTVVVSLGLLRSGERRSPVLAAQPT